MLLKIKILILVSKYQYIKIRIVVNVVCNATFANQARIVYFCIGFCIGVPAILSSRFDESIVGLLILIISMNLGY